MTMNTVADPRLQRLIAALEASPTGRNLMVASFVVPTFVGDPRTILQNPVDGLTFGWTLDDHSYLTTYFREVNEFRTVEMTV